MVMEDLVDLLSSFLERAVEVVDGGDGLGRLAAIAGVEAGLGLTKQDGSPVTQAMNV
jgi:hypothetical protein